MLTNTELVLRVTETTARDVGRGIARIDPEDMKTIGLQTGDVIAIIGKRKTAAKVMPTYPQDRGKDIIQIDGITRSNAEIRLDDRVRIQKIRAEKAAKVILALIGQVRSPFIRDISESVKSLLEGLPLVEGDKIRINFFGSFVQLVVIDLKPKAEALLVCSDTIIKISEKPAEVAERIAITYEDIGGLHNEIQKIREMIELPLRHPEVFKQLGIEPPKGVLLHGPPGTGKTLIAKAVANETDAHFIDINGPEIINKYYGESEARLREIFDDANRLAPSIIFIDELDAIAPKREEVTGEVEKRVVAQLLALMDGLESRGKIIVIGATNRPNALDPALRRPGRFDREIVIGVPNRNGRKEILQIHTRGMPLSENVDLEKLADVTHGFVGADIAALCKEAAMHALRRVLPEIDLEIELIPPEVLTKLKVTMSDFVNALKEIEPSALREVFVEVPNVKWEDIGGLEDAKQELIEAIEWPFKYPDVFKYAKTKPPKGILLYGPPGTGKTMLAKAVATQTEANFISIKGPELFSKFVGESEKAIREVFKKAKQAAPCVIFFDEIDAIAPRRGIEHEDSHVTERVVSQLLTELDGLEELHGCVVLAATNRPDIVDPAILRPGRFDRLIYIPPPDRETREEIFKIHTCGMPLDNDVNINALAEQTENYVGADIEVVCREASMLAIREFINHNSQGRLDFKILKKHFEEALKKVKPIGTKQLEQYQRLMEEFKERY
ncbi:MAG: CDC48 family AAA ATPase [Euryarchaeota archaeon]|nr:CDC48 family AAA ATPase [Euryarchaeota archaeon]